MGYTTDFSGEFNISPAMKPEHVAFINKFSETRRMARNAKETEKRFDPIRIAVGLPVGEEGGYFVGEKGYCGQGVDYNEPPDVINYNEPPKGQPGLWCHWVCSFKDRWGYKSPHTVNQQEMILEWNGNEKFYNYIQWLQYLIDHFFSPWGYTLNGEVKWKGEYLDDIGIIKVVNNIVEVTIRKEIRKEIEE